MTTVSLIIATNYDPLPILKEAIHLITPSSQIVIYCEFMQPLVACYLYLQQSELGIHLQLLDTWMRDFQTLPGRSHPMMNSATSGGYILLGIRVRGGGAEEKEQEGQGQKRPRRS
jgi:tRNA (adenine58-N1)-methyltransferase non-catalytic subunit